MAGENEAAHAEELPRRPPLNWAHLWKKATKRCRAGGQTVTRDEFLERWPSRSATAEAYGWDLDALLAAERRSGARLTWAVTKALAKLRHPYANMVNERVPDTAAAAKGLLGPAIADLERALAEPAGGEGEK